MGLTLLPLYRAATRLAPWALRHVAARKHAEQGASPERLTERFGAPSLSRPEGPLIWMHAASVGEVQTLCALAPTLEGHATLLVTTATQTGAARAQSALPSSTLHQFQPIDTGPAVAAFLDHWAPSLALFSEADTPPNTLRALRQRAIPSALIAARPSKSRRRAPRTMAALLSEFTLITTASFQVADELSALGLATAATEDLKAQAPRTAPAPNWAQAFKRPTWLAASTHPEDAPIILKAHKTLLKTHPDALLILAPRHPENGLPDTAGFTAQTYSESATPTADTQVLLVDVMDQLPALHTASPVSYIGGANADRGGHSPWEAAAAGSHVITGPNPSSNLPAFAALPHSTVDTPERLAATVIQAWQKPRPAPSLPTPNGATLRALEPFLPSG